MAITLLGIIEAVRLRLDDCGEHEGAPSSGYYARWQEDDSGRLWKNAELVGSLKRALSDVAGRAPWTEEGAAADSFGVPTRLAVVAGRPEVALPAATLTVEQVRLVSTGLLLEKTDSGRITGRWGGMWPASPWPDGDWTTATGTPTHYLEPRRGLLRLFPVPTAADELRLTVKRRSLADFEWGDVAHESAPNTGLDDVPDDLEEALVVACCRYAYLKHDSETYNLQLSQDCDRQLAELVGPPVSWRQKEARRINANLDTAIRPASPRYPGRGTGDGFDEREW